MRTTSLLCALALAGCAGELEPVSSARIYDEPAPACSEILPDLQLPSLLPIEDAWSAGSLWAESGWALLRSPVTLLVHREDAPGEADVYLVEASAGVVVAGFKGPDNVDWRELTFRMLGDDMGGLAECDPSAGPTWQFGELSAARTSGDADWAAWLVLQAQDAAYPADPCAVDPGECWVSPKDGRQLPAMQQLGEFNGSPKLWGAERSSAVTVLARYEDDLGALHLFLVDPEQLQVLAWYRGSAKALPEISRRVLKMYSAGNIVRDPHLIKVIGTVPALGPRGPNPPPNDPPPLPDGGPWGARSLEHVLRRAATVVQTPQCAY